MAIVEVHLHCSDPQTLGALQQLEVHLAKQDAAIDAFAVKVNEQFAKVSSNFDNIATDEANLAKQIQDLKDTAGELTADNQVKLDTILFTASSMAERSQSIADAVPDAVTP